MALHLFLFLLVVCFLLSLALFWRLCWLPLQSSHSRGGAKHGTLHRLLKPRSPDDCPDCRLSGAHSSVVEPAPMPVRPWSEVKSRRGAPKRIQTEGFACPNQQCPYFGITDAHIHALVGDGRHGQAEKIQTFRCQACRTTFTSRRHTPFYRLKTPSQQIAMVLSARACGLDPSAAERVFGYQQATITSWLTRAGKHAQTLHERFFSHLHLPHLQLDELRTRLRCATQVLWLWLAIDPTTKLLPVLHLGPRTQDAAHRVIHSLRHILAAFLPPPFHQRWLKRVLLCFDSSFWDMAARETPRAQRAPVAGGDEPDLWPGEKKLPAAQAGSGHARHAPGDRSRSQGLLAGNGLLWTAEYRFYRTGESDRPRCASQLWHAAPGPLPSKPHSCSLTWNGGERAIISCAPMHHFEWRSCSRESVEASWWRNAIGNERQRWQPGEPIDDGRRMRCSLTPCRRFLLERHASQVRLQCHGVEWWVKVPSEEVG